jgi:hypothetical protein
MALYGEVSATRQMRKFGIRFSAHHPQPREVHRAFARVGDAAAWRAVLDDWYEESAPAPAAAAPAG